MSMFELGHPLGQQLETVHAAVSMGMIDELLGKLPYIKVDYKDPLALGNDFATIRVANWNTENITAALFPLIEKPDDPDWTIETEDGLMRVRQRLHIRDMLGRGFPLYIGGEKLISHYLQFDVVDDGVVIIGEEAEGPVMGLGVYDGQTYSLMADMALVQSSLLPLFDLAEAA